ncbi:bifunctional enoyl-CoA hydratase/phosphate acetyltransferase [Thermovenabulum gondwanense]|uniref:Phosphate acetyltransferase n=1 Tax=Thermovenabulum gondwanense TaxID=520767 RepID=A0A162MV59_9FIRM|nr:bifunctional enoyl-CoA hydratase/phosphate acetyltransferase [Thermovenabulum gondwanense]KYO67795.1 Phosphate acetyltransferase [Thermovenabulum gondwanense]
MNTLNELKLKAKNLPKRLMAVVKAEDEDVLKAVKKTREEGIVDAVLIGDKSEIKKISEQIEFDFEGEIIDEKDPVKASLIGVELAKEKKVQALMKGLIQTKDFLKGVLSGDKSLTGGRLLSHVAVFEVENYPKLILVTDAAMNISPDLSQKYQIMKNALQVTKILGIEMPKVALLSAVENVNPSIPSTIDAAVISKMAEREKLKALVDGPLALDNAISKEACEHKGINSTVGGDADILLVPDLISGNILYKSLVYFANAKVAGIVVGAEVPLVLTSRADSDESKAYSISLAALMGK